MGDTVAIGDTAGRIVEEIAGEIGQFALDTFDIEPKYATSCEQQQDITPGGIGGMEFDSHQSQGRLRRGHIDVPRLAGEGPVEP